MISSTNRKLCIVINKPGASLRPSESFLRAHISRLTPPVLPLIGAPTARRIGLEGHDWLLGRSRPARGWRWLMRRIGAATVDSQETRSLAAYIKRERIDVVMAEYGPTGLDVMQACKMTEVPLITHFHGWDAYVLAADPEQRQNYMRLFDVSKAIIAVSRHMREHLISLGAPAQKVVWNPCGADLDDVPQASPATAAPLYITVGRPAPKKATIVSLLAFAKVVKEIPDARLEMIGGGIDTLSLQAARALRIENSVKFVGALPHQAVLEGLQSARCYIHPSVTAPDGDMEGTPVSVMEAMAAALPVVSTRHGGIMDLLDGTSGGILVDEYDVDATAEAMMAYGKDRDRAEADGQEARRLAQARASMTRSIKNLDKIVELVHTRNDEGIARIATEASSLDHGDFAALLNPTSP